MNATDELLVWCTDGDHLQVKSSLQSNDEADFGVKQAALLAAVINGHHEVVEVLLSFDVDVNCRSHDQSNYTPLHFAASKGHLNCAKVLLKYHADITAKDTQGNTPTDLAKRNAKTAVAKLLMSEEIVRAVGMSSSAAQEDNLNTLLNTPPSHLESDCFNRALLTAVSTDNANLIGNLALRGATNIKEALAKSTKEKKLHSMAMLLVLTAAVTNDNFLLNQLIGTNTPTHNSLKNAPVNEIRQVITNDADFLNMPIEIARMHQNETVLHNLLLHNRVCEDAGKVDWHGHNLSEIDQSLFHKFPWVRHLILSSAKLSVISDTFHSNLMMCTKLELQRNNIRHVPNGIFELPFIKEIDLSYNHMIEIYHDDCRWSDSLEAVNLSHNMITHLPGSIIAPYLKTLDISHNHFYYIPSCLKTFKLLTSLNVSYNTSITKIPITLGFLKNLTKLELEGLTNVIDPPKDILNDFTSCMQYLGDKLYKKMSFYNLRLMVMGSPGVGKTTLSGLLANNDSTNKPNQGDDDIVLSEWSYSPSGGLSTHHYSIWDVPGKEEYAVAINLFLRKRTLYLLLWNITEGPNGIASLRKIMYNLSLYAPGCCVIIVATFLDCISVQDRQAGKIQQLLQHAAEFSKQFPLVGVSHITAISLKNKHENFSKLRKYIYQSAEQFMIDSVSVMGQMLSENHHIIYQHIKHLQRQANDGSRIGYMNKKEFIDVQIGSLRKLHFLESNDVFDLLSFFHYAGFLFQTKGLYIFHPSWLFKAVASLKADQHKELINQGVVQKSYLLYILGCEQQVENDVLSILQKSSIALPLDTEKSYFLVPHCILAQRKPKGITIDISLLRYITFKSPISSGFWNRLLVYLIFTVPEIQNLLSSLVPIKGSSSTSSPPPTMDFKFWQEGISYRSPDLQFYIEILKPSRGCNGLERIMICSSPNVQSIQVYCRILDAIFELMQMNFSESDNNILQQVTCMACLKAGAGNSAQLTLGEQLWSAIRKGKPYTECFMRLHELTLRNLLPECFFVDFDSVLLQLEDVSCDKSVQVAFNAKCSVYKGTVRDKNASVMFYKVEDWAIKIRMLRHDARLLDSLNHPCIVSLLGCSSLPEVSLSFEPTPLEESLDKILLHESASISRILLYRVAVQVASALNYLHGKGIALGNLSTSDILMISLDLDALINCKIFCFTNAGYVDYCNSTCNSHPLIPNIILPGSNIVDFRTDMFLYSMFLYWLITRHAPFHNLPESKAMDIISYDGRPSCENDIRAKAGVCHMTHIMKQCWKSDPDERPTAFTVIQQLNSVSMQLLMGVHYINSELSLRNICSVIDDSQALKEVWLCYDANKELDLIICNPQTLEKRRSHSIPDKQVCSIHQHGDIMWVASRLGLETGTIDIFNIESRKHEWSINLSEQSVMSITSTEFDVYFGTYEGFCYKLPANISMIPHDSNDYQSQALSEHSIQGLVVVNDTLWAASNNTIFILDLETLTKIDKLLRATKNRPMPVGQLKPTHDEKEIVSVVFGGRHISLWDVVRPSHVCDINVVEFTRVLELDSVMISAMTPALDTIWVGMDSGLIMVFSLKRPRLLTYFQPYNSYIRFLYCVKGPGACGSEEYIIFCGGKHYQQEGDDGGSKQQAKKNDPGTVTVWEVVSASRLTQMCELSLGDAWISQETLNATKSSSPLLQEEKFATLIDFAQEEEPEVVNEHEDEQSTEQ